MKKNKFKEAQKIADLIDEPEKAGDDELHYFSKEAVAFASLRFLERTTLKAISALCRKMEELQDNEEVTPRQLLEIAKETAELKILLQWSRKFEKANKIDAVIPPVSNPSHLKIISGINKSIGGESKRNKPKIGIGGRSRLANREQLKPPSDLPTFDD